MPTRQPEPASPMTVPLILAVAAVLAGALTWFGYPGLLLAAPAVAFAAVSAPPAILTGKRNAAGQPTPASAAEGHAFNRYRMWSELRFRAVTPSADWLPGWPVRLWWVAAVAAGVLAAALPSPALGDWWRAGVGVSVFAAIVSVNGALRRWTAPDDPCPGPTFDVAVKRLPGATGVVTFLSAVVAAAATFLGTLVTIDRLGLAAAVSPLAPWMVAAAAAVLIGSVTLAVAVRAEALARWRTMVRVRAEWEPRWLVTKLDPAPRLIDHVEHDTVRVDTFDAGAAIGAAAIYPLVGKITASLGSGSRAAVLEAPDVDSQGQPIPGTKHPTRFRVVTFVGDDMPDVTSSAVNVDEAQLRVAAAFSWMSDQMGYGRWVIGNLHPLHSPDAEDTTAAWQVEFAAPDGPGAKDMRHGPMGDVAALAGAEMLIDHRQNSVYVGALTSGTTQWADPRAEKAMQELALTDTWDERWQNILKLGAVRPRPEHAVFAEATYGRATLSRQPFVVQQGLDPLEFFKLESKIATTLNAAPFVAVTGFAGSGDRPGERHPQAFTVTWSQQPLPSNPDKLEPQIGEGPQWILAGRLNAAFDVARLARPEVFAVRALTAKESRGGHIWEIKLRLHGGVTLAEVRTASQRIRQALGSEWLRVAANGDTVSIVAGVDIKTTRNVRFAQPEKRNRDLITALDWEQAFSDAKVIGQGGMLPVLTRTDVLPNNDQVQVLDFKLPTGTSRALVKEAVSKLSTTTGNSFIDVRESPDGADSVRLLVSRDNPLPERASMAWDVIDAAEGIPFATGIEGEPIEFDNVNNPHVLLAGVTGAGKSVLAQVFIYGALVRGSLLYVIDPVKGGADFQFAKEHAVAMASTAAEAQAVMKSVYAEVVRRKNANAAAGVGSIADLPEPPPRIFVMIDEFTSLMGQDQVPPASDDPVAELEREEIIANNRAKTDVGVYAGKIAREARSAGVHLLLGTQKLSAKMLDTIPGAGDLKTNLARVLLGKTSSGDRMSALRAFQDAPELTGDIPKGRGLYEPLTSSAVAAQVWFAPQADLREQLLARRAPLSAEERLDVAALLPKSASDEQDALRHFTAPTADEDEPAEVVVAEFALDLDDLVNEDEVAEAAAEEAIVDAITVVDSSYPAPHGSVHIPVEPQGSGDITGWWQLDWVLEQIAAEPGKAVVWHGVDFNDVDELGITYRDLIAEAFAVEGRTIELVEAAPEMTAAAGDDPAPQLAPPPPVTLAPAPAPASIAAASAPAPTSPALTPSADLFEAPAVKLGALDDTFDPAPAERPGTVFDDMF